MSSSSEAPQQTINGYLSAFITMVDDQLPAEEPGQPTMSELLGVYVGKHNKRQIYIYIRTGPAEILRVAYLMPVPAKYARIFKQPAGAVVPHEDPVFSHLPVTMETDVVALPVAPWSTEIARVTALREDAEAGTVLERTLQGLLLYWNYMRTQLLSLMEQAYIKQPLVMMGEPVPPASASDPSGPPPLQNTDPQSGGSLTNLNRRTRKHHAPRHRLSRRR
jgi:hypothetical protein